MGRRNRRSVRYISVYDHNGNICRRYKLDEVGRIKSGKDENLELDFQPQQTEQNKQIGFNYIYPLTPKLKFKPVEFLQSLMDHANAVAMINNAL